MRHYFTYAGNDSRTYNCYINGAGVFNAPAKQYSTYSVPGRNGDLVLNNNRFANGTLTYKAFIAKQFATKASNFRNILNAYAGYQRLTDTYNPDEYRMALFQSAFVINPTKVFDAGELSITFNVDPRRFLTSGETVTTLTATGTISNPTKFQARPLLRVYGTGTVKIGNDTITISTNASYTDIDCDLREAYRGSTNLNANISLSGLDFPYFKSGSNTITLSSGITQVEITPRWWKL